MAQSKSADRYAAPLLIKRVEDEAPWGLSSNLSVSGMFLETVERQPVGTEHTISFVWGEDVFTCRVRVVRHDRGGVGLVFLSPAAHVIEALEEVMASSPKLERVGPQDCT